MGQTTLKLGTLCYVKQKGKTLMLHRIKKENDMHAGKWNGLGGKLEPGETPEECVIREVYEESGLTIRNPRFHGMLTFPGFDNDDWYGFVFTATDFSGTLIDSPEGVLQWIADDELLDLNIWEGDKVFLKWLARDDFFSGKFVYKNNKLVEHDVRFYGPESP